MTSGRDVAQVCEQAKWAQIAKCSPDTALRDISDLIRRGVPIQDATGGRSTSYSLCQNP